ncbi:MAG: hypothetical protein U0105_02565 [Candidatus Obscuribacterales bacterium]
MLRKSGGRKDDSSKKRSDSGSAKEGAFEKNWGKLDQSAGAAGDRGVAVGASQAQLNATILAALNSIDKVDFSGVGEGGGGGGGGTGGGIATDSPSGGPASFQSGFDTSFGGKDGMSPGAAAATTATDPSTAKTEATATGLGPSEVLNVMWEHLELMANQYNNIVGEGPFHVKLQRHHEGQSRSSMSTLTHALMLIPDVDAVRLYVLPVEMNRDDKYNQGPQFEPNSIVLMTRRGARTEWNTKAGVPLTANVMNSTCRSLFQSLIEQTASYYA